MAKRVEEAGGEVARPKRRRSPNAGKPEVPIDIVELGKLAHLQVTIDEAAAWFGCAKRTMARKLARPEYREVWDQGRARGRLSLRRLQWRHANGTGAGAVQMTIHLSKHWLGETDRLLITPLSQMSTAEIERRLELDEAEADPKVIQLRALPQLASRRE